MKAMSSQVSIINSEQFFLTFSRYFRNRCALKGRRSLGCSAVWTGRNPRKFVACSLLGLLLHPEDRGHTSLLNVTLCSYLLYFGFVTVFSAFCCAGPKIPKFNATLITSILNSNAVLVLLALDHFSILGTRRFGRGLQDTYGSKETP
jgi:hypothetical protein